MPSDIADKVEAFQNQRWGCIEKFVKRNVYRRQCDEAAFSGCASRACHSCSLPFSLLCTLANGDALWRTVFRHSVFKIWLAGRAFVFSDLGVRHFHDAGKMYGHIRFFETPLASAVSSDAGLFPNCLRHHCLFSISPRSNAYAAGPATGPDILGTDSLGDHSPLPARLLEGAFWSLYVEPEFYVVAGLLFFLIGRRNLIIVMAAIFALGEGMHLMHLASASQGLSIAISSMKQFGWFAAGALFYCYFYERRSAFLQAALLMAFMAALGTSGMDWDVLRAALCVVALFGTAIYSHRFQQAISLKPLMLLGFVSYPFYLMHENMSVSAIVQLHHAGLGIPMALLPLIPFCAIFAVAYVIARYLEPLMRTAIRRQTAPIWRSRLRTPASRV